MGRQAQCLVLSSPGEGAGGGGSLAEQSGFQPCALHHLASRCTDVPAHDPPHHTFAWFISSRH